MPVLAESYLHRLDPFLLQFSPGVGIRWYGLSYAAGFVIAWALMSWLARTGRSQLKPRQVGDLMCWIILGVLVGGRLGWAIFYEGGRPIIEFDGKLPYWRLLAITDGGMASHGGMLGVIAVCWIYAARHGLSRLHLFDLVAFVCPIGLGLGRIANFINAELWGKALPAAQQTFLAGQGGVDPPWWSIKYPDEIQTWKLSVPEQVARLEQLEPLRAQLGGDQTFLKQIVDAVTGGDTQVAEMIRPLLTAYYPSQLMQALAEGPVLLLALGLVWLKPRRPGVVGSSFLIVYGVLRILTERWRQPDEGVALLAGLSRGQVLSTLMVTVGLIALFIVSRRPVEPLGGLLRARGIGPVDGSPDGDA